MKMKWRPLAIFFGAIAIAVYLISFVGGYVAWGFYAPFENKSNFLKYYFVPLALIVAALFLQRKPIAGVFAAAFAVIYPTGLYIFDVMQDGLSLWESIKLYFEITNFVTRHSVTFLQGLVAFSYFILAPGLALLGAVLSLIFKKLNPEPISKLPVTRTIFNEAGEYMPPAIPNTQMQPIMTGQQNLLSSIENQKADWLLIIPGYSVQPLSLTQIAIIAGSHAVNSTTQVRQISTGKVFSVSELPGVFSAKSYLTALLLSIFLGALGIDRFYTGHIGLGVGKLLTGGGCGIWALVDVILIAMRKVTDSNGLPLK